MSGSYNEGFGAQAETALHLRTNAASPVFGAGSFVAVTPSDTVALPFGVRGLWVGGVGNVAVRGIFDGKAVTLTAVPAGTLIPGRFGYVLATGTTATLIVALTQ